MRGLSWRNFDFLLLGAVVLASAFGAMMIRSAIAGNDGSGRLRHTPGLFCGGRRGRDRAAGEHRLPLLAVHPLADLHRHDAVPDVALRPGAGGIWRAALVSGGRAVRAAHRVCQDRGHPGAGAVTSNAASNDPRDLQVAAEEPGVGVGAGHLDPAAAEPLQRDRDHVHLGQHGVDERRSQSSRSPGWPWRRRAA